MSPPCVIRWTIADRAAEYIHRDFGRRKSVPWLERSKGGAQAAMKPPPGEPNPAIPQAPTAEGARLHNSRRIASNLLIKSETFTPLNPHR